MEDIPEPKKTPEQLEEEQQGYNEFKKQAEELDGYVDDEQLSENGKHISDLQEKHKEYYEEKGGDTE